MIVLGFDVELESLLQSEIVKPFKDDACSTSLHIGHFVHVEVPPVWGGLVIASKVCHELGLHGVVQFILEVEL